MLVYALADYFNPSVPLGNLFPEKRQCFLSFNPSFSKMKSFISKHYVCSQHVLLFADHAINLKNETNL